MKPEKLRRRLNRHRPMTVISMQFPADVIEDLERLDTDPVSALVDSLKRRGVSEAIIWEALTDAARE